METQWMLGVIAVITAAVFLVSWLSVRHLPARRSAPRRAARKHRAGSAPQRIVLIINPAKNGAEAAREKIAAACSEAGWGEPLVLETTLADPGHSQTRRALEAGADVVLVGGGDGTVRVAASVLAGTDVPMGLIPLGTGNLLARNLGMDPNDLDSNIATALFGASRKIDTASITLENDLTGERAEESFLVIAGIGTDAEILADTKDDLKRKFGWMAYSEAGVRHLPGKRQRVSISIDGGTPQVRRIRSILFANCGKLQAGIDFVPDALLDDGELDVVVLSPRSVLGWMWIGAKTVLRHRASIPVIDYYRAKTIRIAAYEPMNTQLDGDVSGSVTLLTVAVNPGSLTVRVNPASIRADATSLNG